MLPWKIYINLHTVVAILALFEQFLRKILFKFLEAALSQEIPVTEVRKSWFAKPETYPNDSPTVRAALQ